MSAEFNPAAPTTPVYDEDGVQRFSELNSRGQEIPDPVPYNLDVGGSKQESLGERIQREILVAHLRQQALEQGFDTPEEADDLDVPDDPIDPLTPWEEEYLAADQRRQVREASPLASTASPDEDRARRISSEGSVSEASQEKKVEKPISGSRVGTPVLGISDTEGQERVQTPRKAE